MWLVAGKTIAAGHRMMLKLHGDRIVALGAQRLSGFCIDEAFSVSAVGIVAVMACPKVKGLVA